MHRILQFIAIPLIAGQAWIAFPIFSNPIGHDVLNQAVRDSALPPVVLGFIAMLGVQPRWNWFIAASLFQVHVAVAFHAAHGWSHGEAFDHVQRTSGVGEGLFLSYAFAVIWLLDAAWLLLRPRNYAARNRIWNWCIFGFLAFIAFNATVIYGEGLARWIGIAGFSLILLQQMWHSK